MPLQLGKIHSSKNPIGIPDDLSLSFTLEVDSLGDYIISYSLSPSNNLYFKMLNGGIVKDITETVPIVNTISSINKDIVVSSSGQNNNSYFFIKVQIKRGVNGDSESCKILIK